MLYYIIVEAVEHEKAEKRGAVNAIKYQKKPLEGLRRAKIPESTPKHLVS